MTGGLAEGIIAAKSTSASTTILKGAPLVNYCHQGINYQRPLALWAAGEAAAIEEERCMDRLKKFAALCLGDIAGLCFQPVSRPSSPKFGTKPHEKASNATFSPRFKYGISAHGFVTISQKITSTPANAGHPSANHHR